MSLALLVLRLVPGLLLSGHGAQKLFGAFGGAGLQATASGFEKGGLRPGPLHAGAAGVTELLAGALLALGAGAWSLDGALGLDLAGTGWALAALGAGLLGGAAVVLFGRQQGLPRPSQPQDHRHAGAH
ncbi:MAG TPA: DoxX family membrane protein [Solirubrobacterales bacterium]|nr:DoxX family membrane protein [Solirubrobacterales bacterium]